MNGFDTVEEMLDWQAFSLNNAYRGWDDDDMIEAFRNRKSLLDFAKSASLDFDEKASATIIVQKMNRGIELNGHGIDKEFKVISLIVLFNEFFNVVLLEGTPIPEDMVDDYFTMLKEFSQTLKTYHDVKQKENSKRG